MTRPRAQQPQAPAPSSSLLGRIGRRWMIYGGCGRPRRASSPGGGPAGFRTEVHAIDARPNGKLHYDHIAESPEMVAAMREMGRPALTTLHGRFSEFRPLERLVLTQMIDFLPGVEPYESTIMVDFFPSGEWVRMVVTLSPMHDEEFTKLASQGLASQLANLDQRFQSRNQ